MPASPILLLVPYRNKAAVLYSQIPTSASASGDMVVSRAGVSTRINAQGLIQSVAANVPRLNYPLGGVANGCPALLVEPAATNLAFHSEVWTSGTNYSLTETTIVTGAIAAPDGAMTANAISPTAASGNHRFFSNSAPQISYVSGTIYTQSAFFKKGTGTAGRYIQLLAAPGPFGGLGFANYDLELGTVSASGGTLVGASIQNFGNGWYRCICTQTATASGSAGGVFASLIPASGSARTPNMTTSSGDVLYGWGAQVETGSVATSYIPTTTGTVTRNADIVTNNTFVIPNLIGAILTEFDSPTSGTYFLDNIPIPIASGSNKIAISYTPTTLTIYRNGAQVSGSPVTPPGGTAPVIGNVINIGHNNQLYQLGSGIKSFVLYSSTLSAAEASGLTT